MSNGLTYHTGVSSGCSYIPGKQARHIVLDISAVKQQDKDRIVGELAPYGFRRDSEIMVTQACLSCNACAPYRVLAQEFVPSRNMKKQVLLPNRDVTATFNKVAVATNEHLSLYYAYQKARHPEGKMKDRTPTAVRNFITTASGAIDYRDAAQKLLAVTVYDEINPSDPAHAGLTGMYTFYDAAESESRSLGTFAILTLIEETRKRNLPYTYMGSRLSECSHMNYKSRFRPAEVLTESGWERFDPEKDQRGPNYGKTFPARTLPFPEFK